MSAAGVTPDLNRAIEAVIGRVIEQVVPAGAGANSIVYRAQTAGNRYAVKTYASHARDGRKRIANEWRALAFLHRNGVAQVPRPIGLDEAQGILVMEWIDGTRVGDVTDIDVEDALRFLHAVLPLSLHDDAAAFGPAAEACLSTAEVVRQIVRRRHSFVSLPDLDRFLIAAFDPMFARVQIETRSYEALDPRFRRLVPADFGFHNALRDGQARLRFFDFDYFGWDDPVKLTADFVLHPGMALTNPLKARFARAVAKLLAGDAGFNARLENALPLFALRWALIVLNPFRRDRWSPSAGTQGLARQLAKAEALCRMGDKRAFDLF